MNIFTRIQSLNLPNKEFVVMGSANLEVKGIRKAQDLDIMIKAALFDQLKRSGKWEYIHKVGYQGDEIDLLEKNGTQLYFHIYGRENFDYFFAQPYRLELINDIYFASLFNLLEVKSGKWDREKDRQDAELIKTYLTTHNIPFERYLNQ